MENDATQTRALTGGHLQSSIIPRTVLRVTLRHVSCGHLFCTVQQSNIIGDICFLLNSKADRDAPLQGGLGLEIGGAVCIFFPPQSELFCKTLMDDQS